MLHRATDRQKNKKTDRAADSETNRETDREVYRQRDRQTDNCRAPIVAQSATLGESTFTLTLKWQKIAGHSSSSSSDLLSSVPFQAMPAR